MTPKPRKLPAATIGRICREVIGHVSSIEAHSALIAKANEWIDDGVQGADYSRVKRGGAEGSATEMAALKGGMDLIGKNLTEFAQGLEELAKLARRLDKMRETIEADWLTDDRREAAERIARRSAEAAGGGDCVTCHRVVSGSRVDRLREGRCGACAKYRQRNPGKERPRHLWSGDSIDDRCQNVLTRGGVDYPCGLLWGHDEDCRFAVSVA